MSKNPSQEILTEEAEPEDEERPEGQWERLLWYQKVAEFTLAIALTVFGGWARLQDLVANWSVDFPVHQLTFALLVMSVVLAFLWYFTTNQEMRQLRNVGEDFIPDVPRYIVILIVVATITLVLLFVTSAWPLAFGLALLALKTMEAWNSWLAKLRIGPGIKRLVDTDGVPGFKKKRAHALRKYYFDHPWDQLAASEMAIIALAIGLAAFALADPNLDERRVGTSVAAALLIVAVVINEAVAYWWRRIRDQEMKVRPARASGNP